MRPRITVNNAERVRAAIEQYGESIEKNVRRLIQDAALKAVTEVKQKIQGPPKTGVIYERGKIKHQSSAPGQAPATDTGTLVSSIYYIGAKSPRIGSRLPYAFYLEYGTMMMRPRPSWVHAVVRARNNLNKEIDSLLKALNK
jgi:hypothetical protein